MSFLSRLLGTGPDPRETVRPLWHRVIELARDPVYYADCQVADTVAGRFDVICAVLCTVMVRVEAAEMRAESALLAELFVEDMDGQLRELGVNARDREKLVAAVGRNVTFREGADEDACAEAVADRIMALSQRLAGFDEAALLKASGIW